MTLNKALCLSVCLALLVAGVAKQDSPPSIITILSMATCKSTCKSGSCEQQIGTALPNFVKCECNPGWQGDKCDIPSDLGILKVLGFPSLYPFPGAATDADLARIAERARNHEASCAGNFVCYNGGYCTGTLHTGFRCKCVEPYTGTFCNELCEKKCLNGGECFREAKFGNGTMDINKVCKCPRRYQGEFCEHKLGFWVFIVFCTYFTVPCPDVLLPHTALSRWRHLHHQHQCHWFQGLPERSPTVFKLQAGVDAGGHALFNIPKNNLTFNRVLRSGEPLILRRQTYLSFSRYFL